jgi:galactokinase/mevalonate kinase-like predicted kinase
MTDQEKMIEEFFNRGVLINPDLLDKGIKNSLFEKISSEADIMVLNNDYVDLITQSKSLVDWYDLDHYRVNAEKDRDDDLYQTQLLHFQKSTLSIDSSNIPPSSNTSSSSSFSSSLINQNSNIHQEQHFSILETELEENNYSF